MTITLETPRLMLRQFSPEDSEDYHRAIFSDADVMRYLPGGVPRRVEDTSISIQKILDHWQIHGFGLFALVFKEDARLVGHAGLMRFTADGEEMVEVAYGLAKAYWGKGMAGEAARACLQFGFEALNLPVIAAVYEPENAASRRVMEKIGMTFQRDVEAYGIQLPMFAITREEFFRRSDTANHEA